MPNNGTLRVSIPSEAEIGALLAGAVQEAARQYLDVFLAKVPSYTGVSRGQLAPLAAGVGVSLPQVGEVSSKTGIDKENQKASFTVAFPVEYFQINEVADATKWGIHLQQPGPYNALPAAEAAAEEVLQRAGEAVLNNLAATIMAGLGGK